MIRNYHHHTAGHSAAPNYEGAHERIIFVCPYITKHTKFRQKGNYTEKNLICKNKAIGNENKHSLGQDKLTHLCITGLNESPTRSLECTCSSLLSRGGPPLSGHASSPGPCLGYRQGSFLSCLFSVFRRPRGATLPLATTICLALRALLCFFQLLRTIPSLIRGGAFFCICLQLERTRF